MKRRRTIIWMGILLISLAGLLYCYFRHGGINTSTVSDSNAASPYLTTNVQGKSLGLEIQQSSITNQKKFPLTFIAPRASKKPESESDAFSRINDVRILFYGKLLDQYNNPVAGANITGGIIYDNAFSSGVKEIQTISDSNGLFKLDGGKGESLSVTPRKEGYVISSTNASFKYSHFYARVRHIPDPSKPVIIQMWKLQGAEPLIDYVIRTLMPLNGTPVSFDLQTGKAVATGGDLILRIESTPTPTVTKQYFWSALVKIVDGGMMPCDDRQFDRTFLLPESGYVSEFVIENKQGQESWSSRFHGGFFIKSRGGQCYGKIGIGITTDLVIDGKIPVVLAGYLNPAGSRNLEIDPKLVTEVKTKGEAD